MRYSIITPTIVRSTLPILCDSIDRQTDGDWEHLIAVDVDDLWANPHKQKILDGLRYGRRAIYYCRKPHRDTGNTCRHEMSLITLGDYVLYVDDDNYYADDRVLETLETVTAPLASFSLLYKGEAHSSRPVESSNVMVRRGLHVFPALSERNADQIFVTRLLERNLTVQEITDRPLVVVPFENTGIDH